MKTAIVFYSEHHRNTRKLVDAIKADDETIKLIDITKTKVAELDGYDVIGVASGIYMSKFNKDLLIYLRNKLPEHKAVFALYTCGQKRDSYSNEVRDIAKDRHCKWLGAYGCLGFDTFGPFKIVGGIAKGHPTDEEIQGAVTFYKKVNQE